jgi:hypothetical protein
VDDLSNRMREVATIIQDEGYVTLGNSCIDAAAELDRLRRELEEAQRDAARWRHVMCKECGGNGWYAYGPPHQPEQCQCEACYGTGIDAAMAEPKEVPSSKSAHGSAGGTRAIAEDGSIIGAGGAGWTGRER